MHRASKTNQPLTDQLNRSVSQTSWTDQLSLFEALASLHSQRLTFQFVCCRSFRVRRRPFLIKVGSYISFNFARILLVDSSKISSGTPLNKDVHHSWDFDCFYRYGHQYMTFLPWIFFVQTFFLEKVWIKNTLPKHDLDIYPKFVGFLFSSSPNL